MCYITNLSYRDSIRFTDNESGFRDNCDDYGPEYIYMVYIYRVYIYICIYVYVYVCIYIYIFIFVGATNIS